MKEKIKKKEKIMNSSVEWKEFRAKREHETGFRFFCKQLWRELNENIWGKIIILVGIIFIIGNIIIRIFEFNRTIDLFFNIPLMILLCYFSIMYTKYKED